MMPADFHFLRPEWLLAILPGLALAGLLLRRMARGQDDWRGRVDAHLLRHLAVRDKTGRRKWPVGLLLLGWIPACIAMAGPAWQKVPVPALDQLDPTVIVLSLAQSMNATDQNPNRLVAARHKVEDILRRMKGGQVALVIYADAPFVAAPLTEDGRVIAQMLPEIATDLMPVLHDRPDLALQQAVGLLRNTGAPTGRIVLITDGTGELPDRTLAAARAAAEAGYSVHVIGVGGGTPVPLLDFQGQAVRGRDGAARTTRLEADRLGETAAAGGGRFVRLSTDASDLDAVLARAPAGPNAAFQNNGLTADEWVDMGPYLVLAVAVIASLAFRRGWLAALPLALLLGGLAAPRPALAQETDPSAGLAWSEMWRTPDQRGAASFQGGDYAGAAATFENPAWKASALYKDGAYDKAAAAYGQVAGDHYNRGNALARAGQLREAVAAYDEALKADPKDADAAFNRDIVLKALEQQQKQQQQQQDQQQQDQNQQNQQKQDQAQKKPDQGKPEDKPKDQKQDQKPQDQKPEDKKPQDQKGQDQKPQDKGQNPQPQQPKPDPAKPDPVKPDPAKQDPAKPDPAKPEPAKPEPAKQEPAKPDPAKPEQPQPPQQQQAKPEPPPQEPPPPEGIAVRPMTEQDQNREQTLRMVPDDPTGLLRARIRSYYSGTVVPTVEDPR
ncbi:MAG: VWA domain-containing protein [Rhizobiales bacterium]|nr:VWA domain-containing protein [Hyphomicrobiales bacterium]